MVVTQLRIRDAIRLSNSSDFLAAARADADPPHPLQAEAHCGHLSERAQQDGSSIFPLFIRSRSPRGLDKNLRHFFLPLSLSLSTYLAHVCTGCCRACCLPTFLCRDEWGKALKIIIARLQVDRRARNGKFLCIYWYVHWCSVYSQ